MDGRMDEFTHICFYSCRPMYVGMHAYMDICNSYRVCCNLNYFLLLFLFLGILDNSGVYICYQLS